MSCDVLLRARAVTGVEPTAPCAHLELQPEPTAAGRARQFVAEHADPQDPDDAMSLLTSELVTNAVLHARTALVLGVTKGTERVLVTVADGDGDGTPKRPPPDDERPSGRGLMLVAALASEWGVFENEEGKTVWFTLPRATSGSRGAAAS